MQKPLKIAPDNQGSSTFDKQRVKQIVELKNGSQSARDKSDNPFDLDLQQSTTMRESEQLNSPSSTSADSSGPKKKSMFLMKRLSKMVNRIKDVETSTQTKNTIRYMAFD